jgi:hypothetical protein
MYCKYCGHALSGEEKFCPACGGAIHSSEEKEGAETSALPVPTPTSASTPAPAPAPTPKRTERCFRCGQILTEADKECPFCRYPVVRTQNAAPFYTPLAEEKDLKKLWLIFGILSVVLAVLSPLIVFLFFVFLPVETPLFVYLLPFPIAAVFGIVAIIQGSRHKNTPAIVTGVIGLILSVLFFIATIILFIVYVYYLLIGGFNYY